MFHLYLLTARRRESAERTGQGNGVAWSNRSMSTGGTRRKVGAFRRTTSKPRSRSSER